MKSACLLFLWAVLLVCLLDMVHVMWLLRGTDIFISVVGAVGAGAVLVWMKKRRG